MIEPVTIQSTRESFRNSFAPAYRLGHVRSAGRDFRSVMQSVNCLQCHRPVSCYPSRIRQFCSKSCRYTWMKLQPKNHVDLKCQHCGKDYAVEPHRKTKSRFCSFLCRQSGISIETATKRGNTLRYSGNGKTYVKFHQRHLHRCLGELKIGRKLSTDEVVHHINGNPRDNRLENLTVMTNSEHTILHHTHHANPS